MILLKERAPTHSAVSDKWNHAISMLVVGKGTTWNSLLKVKDQLAHCFTLIYFHVKVMLWSISKFIQCQLGISVICGSKLTKMGLCMAAACAYGFIFYPHFSSKPIEVVELICARMLVMLLIVLHHLTNTHRINFAIESLSSHRKM